MNDVVQEAWGLETWDTQTIAATIDELWALRRAMHERAAQLEPWLVKVDPALHPSALNLAHYLALRAVDLRALQDRLAWMGVSSLGRAETHVLANVDKVLGILHRLAGRPWQTLSHEEPIGFTRGPAMLAQHAAELFGPAPARRTVRIMVTLPSEAAHDEALVARLVDAGMDIARINCAHDEAPQWRAMAESVRRYATWAGREVRVLMDLGGPKLRTGAVADAPAVIKLQPERDAWGRVTQAARLGLRPSGSELEVTGAQVCLGVDASWLARLEVGARINLTDARTSTRRLEVVERQGDAVLLHCEQTAYLTNQVCLRLHQRGHDVYKAWLTDIPPQPGQLHLRRGDLVHVVADGVGRDATVGKKSKVERPAVIACTLPEALAKVRKGEHIWFDDGRIGGVVRRAGAKRLEVQITEARDSGERLAADKGINLPDTHLDLPALTAKDLQDLEVVASVADMVGMSFAQSADDVLALRARLLELGAPQLGLILKIETSRGFEHLPELLLAAMTGPCAGVMIARGDLAVECGYERLAEVQEEILWACEAAHLPVVWATQVLETLAKTGLPSRAEITDAAMGGRAECVMLNKGPHIVLAMQTLDDILTRMQSHQLKKRSLLRALAAWDMPARRKKQKRARDELAPLVG